MLNLSVKQAFSECLLCPRHCARQGVFLEVRSFFSSSWENQSCAVSLWTRGPKSRSSHSSLAFVLLTVEAFVSYCPLVRRCGLETNGFNSMVFIIVTVNHTLADIDHFHHCRKFHWALMFLVVWVSWIISFKKKTRDIRTPEYSVCLFYLKQVLEAYDMILSHFSPYSQSRVLLK